MENGTASAADKLILVVDDDRGVRELLQIILQREGFRTELAEDGDEGLRKARGARPDLILLDLMLPKANGLEVVRELQADGNADTPVVIMTGRFMDRSTSEMIKYERNVKDYLEKPVKPALLAALIHKLLGTRPAQKGPAA
jgi:DNA-binding response OmpR family regulator